VSRAASGSLPISARGSFFLWDARFARGRPRAYMAHIG
jgi:hypothetical protein